MFAHHQRHFATLKKRHSEVAAISDRLLNTYLAGTIDESTFKAKSTELKWEALRIEESLQKVGQVDNERCQRAIALFDSSHKAVEVWLGSNNTVRRRILDAVCLNRTLSDVSLVAVKRKPFDQLAKRLENDFSRRGGI